MQRNIIVTLALCISALKAAPIRISGLAGEITTIEISPELTPAQQRDSIRKVIAEMKGIKPSLIKVINSKGEKEGDLWDLLGGAEPLDAQVIINETRTIDSIELGGRDGILTLDRIIKDSDTRDRYGWIYYNSKETATRDRHNYLYYNPATHNITISYWVKLLPGESGDSFTARIQELRTLGDLVDISSIVVISSAFSTLNIYLKASDFPQVFDPIKACDNLTQARAILEEYFIVHQEGRITDPNALIFY